MPSAVMVGSVATHVGRDEYPRSLSNVVLFALAVSIVSGGIVRSVSRGPR